MVDPREALGMPLFSGVMVDSRPVFVIVRALSDKYRVLRRRRKGQCSRSKKKGIGLTDTNIDA